MNTYTATVLIFIKPQVLNPADRVIKKALADLGFSSVEEYQDGKCKKIKFKAESKADALETARQMCDKLLCLPVTEEVRSIEISEV